MRRKTIRLGAFVLLIIAVLVRLNPRGVLPDTFSYSGDFWATEYGLRVRAFEDILNIVIASAAALLILSYTTLIADDPPPPPHPS